MTEVKDRVNPTNSMALWLPDSTHAAEGNQCHKGKVNGEAKTSLGQLVQTKASNSPACH